MFSIKCPLFEILTTIVKFKAFFLCLRSRTSITQLAFFGKNLKLATLIHGGLLIFLPFLSMQLLAQPSIRSCIRGKPLSASLSDDLLLAFSNTTLSQLGLFHKIGKQNQTGASQPFKMAKKPQEEAFCFAVIAIRLRLLPPFFIKEKRHLLLRMLLPYFLLATLRNTIV